MTIEKVAYLPPLCLAGIRRSTFWHLGIIRANAAFVMIVSETGHVCKKTNNSFLPKADVDATMKSTKQDDSI